MPRPFLKLKPGKEKPVLQRHPWIFSGALDKLSDEQNRDLDPGTIVDVLDHRGHRLAFGYYNHRSQIRCRLLHWYAGPGDVEFDTEFVFQRIDRAFKSRAELLRSSSGGSNSSTDSARLIHAEADLLPGLIVDKIGDFLVLQILTAGMARVRDLLVECLIRASQEHFGTGQTKGIYERSDEAVRKLEGLEQTTGVLWGQTPSESGVIARENGMEFIVDIARGHKTGFYFDQRDSRQAVRDWSAGADVLNTFSYTGGFSVAAAVGGARSVLSVDISESAVELCRDNMARNQACFVAGSHHESFAGDVFEVLRQLNQDGRQFDLVVLDPPKFAQSAAHVDRACRGYKDINRLAMKIIRPGGFLATFSCSGLISSDLFQKVVFSAALDARRHVQIIQNLSQALCHPVLFSFPEGRYLKGFLCRVLGPDN